MGYRAPVKEGTTLSQRGLAMRLNMVPSTIRRRGDKVMGYVHGVNGTWREHWERIRYANGATHGYRFVEREGSIERTSVVSVNHQDEHYLKSILGNLREIKAQVEGPSLGGEVLADNVDWLDCFVDRVTRSLA